MADHRVSVPKEPSQLGPSGDAKTGRQGRGTGFPFGKKMDAVGREGVSGEDANLESEGSS